MTCELSLFTMYHPDLTVSNFMSVRPTVFSITQKLHGLFFHTQMNTDTKIEFDQEMLQLHTADQHTNSHKT